MQEFNKRVLIFVQIYWTVPFHLSKGMIKIIELNVFNFENKIVFSIKSSRINCKYNGEYKDGDRIYIKAQDVEFLKIKLDDTLPEAVIYTQNGCFEYKIPSGSLKAGYPKEAFEGESHHITVSEATDDEVYGKRNISFNPYDLRGQKQYFPHAYANLVTREDPCFFERNAIDGFCENKGPGSFPYHSWAGGAREDLEYYIDFGRDSVITYRGLWKIY